MTNNKREYPDDLIGNVQEEILRLIEGVDDTIPMGTVSYLEESRVMVRILRDTEALLTSLNDLRKTLDFHSSI